MDFKTNKFSTVDGIILMLLLVFDGIWISMRIYFSQNFQPNILIDWPIAFFTLLIYFMFTLAGFDLRKYFKQLKQRIHTITGEGHDKKI